MKRVPVDATEDDNLYFGHALVTLHTAVPDGPVRLIVSRGSTDTPFLGMNGWQASPAAIDVETVSRSENQSVLRAGPAICDRIPFNQPVRLQLEGTDIFGEVFWPEVGPSIGKYVSPLGVANAPPQPETSAPTKRETLPPPVTPPPIPLLPPVPLPTETATPTPPPRKRNRSWVYLMLVLLLIGGAGAVYTQWGKIAPTPTPEPTPQPPPETLSAKLERLRQSDPNGDGLLALNEEAFNAGNRTIAQQSIDLSIERGNEAAKLRLARWYDPRTFDAQHVLAKDANKAARAYFELALGGNTEARGLLTSICEAGRGGGADYEGFFDTTYCQGNIDP